MVYGDKVCDVDWDQAGNVDILSFRSGAWDRELIGLLRAEGNITSLWITVRLAVPTLPMRTI